jgi:hypothetical protein
MFNFSVTVMNEESLCQIDQALCNCMSLCAGIQYHTDHQSTVNLYETALMQWHVLGPAGEALQYCSAEVLIYF